MNKMTHHDMVLARNCVYGDDVKIFGPANIYDSEFSDGVRVFNFCEIGGAKIGKNTKISSHCYICPGVEIGAEVFVGHGVCFTNDIYSDVPSYEKLEDLSGRWNKRTTVVGNRVRIGSNCTILPVHIGDDVILGAGSVITKDVPSGETWAGCPAKKI